MKRTPLKRRTPLKAKKPWLPKRKKRMPRFSRIGRLKNEVYQKQSREFREEHPRCEFMRWPDGTPAPRLTGSSPITRKYTEGGVVHVEMARQCTRRTAGVHHVRKRGRWLNDKRYFFPGCFDDHEWIENNKRGAVRLGYLERVYEKH